jgi:hypothetical protein
MPLSQIHVNKILYIFITQILNKGKLVNLAAGLGIEPKFSLSESDVLPLYDPAMGKQYCKIGFFSSKNRLVRM